MDQVPKNLFDRSFIELPRKSLDFPLSPGLF